MLQPFDGVFEVGLADCVVIQEDGGAGAVFAPQSSVLQTHKHTHKQKTVIRIHMFWCHL